VVVVQLRYHTSTCALNASAEFQSDPFPHANVQRLSWVGPSCHVPDVGILTVGV
jgi:hypothetical protein